MNLPGERDRLADMRDSADPCHRSLDPEPEAGVHERPVLPQVEVPAVRGWIEALAQDPREQPVVVVLAL